MCFKCVIIFELSEFTCICENDFIINQDTGECTTRVCDDGFGGEHNCMNGGSCTVDADGVQGCTCPTAISGPNCEIGTYLS